MTSKLNNRPNAGIAIYQLPEANALDVAKRVNAKMAELGKAFPKGLVYEVPFDTTRFVNASIHEVFLTLIEAGVLVLIVIVLFLQDWRAMLVPATTIPVTIIGAFAAMAALGFTVNTTTLFGIVLAIGIVVDDAIVIVEGVAHHIERGMTPHDAAIKAMERAVRAGDRHHPGADVGVPAGRLRARPDRPDVRPVRPGDRGHRLHQRGQRRDPEAHPVRHVAPAHGAAGEAQRLLPRLQQGLRQARGRLRLADRRRWPVAASS